MSTESRELAEHLHARTGAPVSVCARWAAEVFQMVAVPGRNALAKLGALRMIAESAGFVVKAAEPKGKDGAPAEAKPAPLTYTIKEPPKADAV